MQFEMKLPFYDDGFREIKPKVKKYPPAGDLLKPYVAIAEASTAFAKLWSYPNGWQTVVNYLKFKGYNVVSVSKEETKLQEVIKRHNQPIEKTIANIVGADFLIGLGSGLSWLSWALDVPVILISGFSAPWCEFQDCIRIHPGKGCHSCFNCKDLTFDRGNFLWCPRSKNFECSRNITPEMVIEGIEKAIEKKKVLISSKPVQPPTGRPLLLKALNMLPAKPVIVEVGMSRQEGNWQGDGYSTPLFAHHVEKYGGQFYSVDIDPEAIKVSKKIMSSYGIEGRETYLICADALSFFQCSFIPKISLMYLDCWDYVGDRWAKEESANKHLKLFKLIEPYLDDGALVVVDDIFQDDTIIVGKGSLAIPYMIELGYEVVERGYQFILRKPKPLHKRLSEFVFKENTLGV